jgi:hypothetical protein
MEAGKMATIFFFFGSMGFKLSLTLARQMFYHLIHSQLKAIFDTSVLLLVIDTLNLRFLSTWLT